MSEPTTSLHGEFLDETNDARSEPSDGDVPDELADGESTAIAEGSMMEGNPGLSLTETDVPDPFLVDDPDEPISDSEDEDEEPVPPSEYDVTPADEIALAQSTIFSPPTAAFLLNKPTPPTPNPSSPKPFTSPSAPLARKDEDSSSSSEEDDSPLDLYLPKLVLPTMFHPLPNTDPLSTLLNKYIPPEKRPYRDLSGDNPQRHDFHTLVMTNNWRAIAKMARDRIVASDPSEVSVILNLWYIRLASLARLRLFSQTTAECNNLFNALQSTTLSPSASNTQIPGSRSAPPTPAAAGFQTQTQAYADNMYDYIRTHLLPFELLVLKARTKYWAGDHMGYLDELRALLGWCKSMSRRACTGSISRSFGSVKPGKPKSKAKRDEQAVSMWKERGARLILIMASQLIEIKDYTAAVHLLNSLASSSHPVPHLEAIILRTHLQSGLVPLAEGHLHSILSADSTLSPDELKLTCESLAKSAEGQWEEVETQLRTFVDKEKLKGSANVDKSYFVAVNNLSVAMLSQGKLKEAIQVLEDALHQSPSTIVTAEPFLFNLSTLYELRSNTAADKKRDLLIEVGKWAGDGVRTSCLKMPAT
ncbi:unnamed protein product [Somion occarium]|uniref:Trafficking protein particle complex subunit 12 n=1 Tax=Somion occarium TaxID=3059160 RepID=A0ABP1E6Q9_9APHY